MLVGTENKAFDNPQRMRKTPSAGFGIKYLIKTLEIVQTEIRSAEYLKRSPYRMKDKAFGIMDWCVEKNFCKRREHFKSSFSSRKRPSVYYEITEYGRELLEMIR